MARILVENSGALKGRVKVNGAKNAVLPIMAAALLAEDKCILDDVPELRDVEVMSGILRAYGAKVSDIKGGVMEIAIPEITSITPPDEYVSNMRASFFTAGPILGRKGHVRIMMPGGCAIGARPIDLHLKGFAALGAEIKFDHDHVEIYAEKLVGTTIYLDFPSVGATENIMMAAVLAEGTTFIENSAQEPEIIDLANFLNKMGANVKGAGTDTIRIQGVKRLTGTRHAVIPDRIEAATYMVAAAITNGDVIIDNVVPSHLKPITAKLKECGVLVEETDDTLRVVGRGKINAVDVTTLPYPGFPTDAQSQFMALMTVANGKSHLNETVFENRFMHVDEFAKMGADIHIDKHTAVVHGGKPLVGAESICNRFACGGSAYFGRPRR